MPGEHQEYELSNITGEVPASAETSDADRRKLLKAFPDAGFADYRNWRGTENVDAVIADRTGQILVLDAPAPGAGWP